MCGSRQAAQIRRVLVNKYLIKQFDNCVDFVDCVSTIRHAGWGMNTNFYAALDLILDTAIKNSVSPEVGDIVCAVLPIPL